MASTEHPILKTAVFRAVKDVPPARMTAKDCYWQSVTGSLSPSSHLTLARFSGNARISKPGRFQGFRYRPHTFGYVGNMLQELRVSMNGKGLLLARGLSHAQRRTFGFQKRFPTTTLSRSPGAPGCPPVHPSPVTA